MSCRRARLRGAVEGARAGQQEGGAAVAELQAAFADMQGQLASLHRGADHAARHARCHVRAPSPTYPSPLRPVHGCCST